jgi:hypothetical protein
MAGSPATLGAALDGRRFERPLRAPLLAALAAEVEELDVRDFLADAGKRSRILAGLAGSLPLDVLVVDSGSGWDAEADGFVLDWTGGYPPALRPGPAGVEPRFDPARGGAPVILDVLRRAPAMIPDSIALGVTLTGPASLAAASGAGLSLAAATQIVLAAARAVAEGGAAVVIVREDGAVHLDAAEYARVTAALWRSVRFFRSAGVLQVSGAADGWVDVLTSTAPFLPVFNADQSPAVASSIAAAGRPYGLALAPETAGVPDATFVTGRCALLTHDRDLTGHIPVRDVAAVTARMTC